MSRETGSGQAENFYPRTIRTLKSVEILELVCYQGWRIFHHDKRWWFLCPWTSPGFLSGTCTHSRIWCGNLPHLGSFVTNYSPLFLIFCLVDFFKSLFWTYAYQRDELKFWGNEWDCCITWKSEVYTNLKILDKRKNASWPPFVPFPHGRCCHWALEFGENLSKNRQLCIAFSVPLLI